jgi:hypothetical protein
VPAKTRDPSWWSESPASAWERLKEAVRRDWQQTKHDLHVTGGHELNQRISDTLKQAAGTERIPARRRPNPPRVLGELGDIEEPRFFGDAAFGHYGALYPTWSAELEATLERDWERTEAAATRPWSMVRARVREGYERPRSHVH